MTSFYRERTPDLSKIEYPTLVIANWGGLGLHLRGTIRGYIGIASREKWLKVQAGSYFHTFLQRQPHNMASATYPALSAGVTFSTAPWEQNVEIVGPVKAKLFISSSTRDMDIFATVCAFDPQGDEMIQSARI
jgi:predicted acyl esterase